MSQFKPEISDISSEKNELKFLANTNPILKNATLNCNFMDTGTSNYKFFLSPKFSFLEFFPTTLPSEDLDIPIGTVKAQLHRSREQLFQIMSGSRDTF